MASDCGSSSSESDISLVIEDGYSSGGDDYDGTTEYDEEEVGEREIEEFAELFCSVCLEVHK